MSSVLLIDAGNTRIKWQLRSRFQSAGDDGAVAQGNFRHDAANWAEQWQLPDAPSAVWVGSVAGDAVNAHIATWCAGQSFRAPVFVQSQREALGLRVAYRDVSRLGVDRFLAMLGARQRAPGPYCVIDVGTAMTLDAVDVRGMHAGGLIAPGPQAMVRALLRDTAGIRDASDTLPTSEFARDTAEAVTGGACFAAAALLDRFVTAASTRFGEKVSVYLAGGARRIVARLAQCETEDAPELVFDGLMALSLAGVQTARPDSVV